MAPQISESYASPGLRLGLLLEDHPDATYTFRMVDGAEIGVPPSYGGDRRFCLCRIEFGAGRAPVEAWKPVPDKGDPDQWNILCTKTLGRALKRAGYPDDLHDLKALVLWRQRDAEIAAIRGGSAQISLPSANAIAALPAADPMQQALDAAGVADAEAVGADEVDVVTGEIVADPAEIETLTELLDGLTAKERKAFEAFAKTINAPTDPSLMSEQDRADVLAWLDPEGEQ
jgi:hypothetical protein